MGHHNWDPSAETPASRAKEGALGGCSLTTPRYETPQPLSGGRHPHAAIRQHPAKPPHELPAPPDLPSTPCFVHHTNYL